jgi:sterol desaturase/sphingolipid hydroxylase (fatty acid hydroxylase superfamily)
MLNMDNQVIEIALSILTINVSRYFFFAFPAFVLFYLIYRKKWAFKKIQQSFPEKKDYLREIGYSMITILIFVGIGLIAFATPLQHYNLRYPEISDYGWGYWVVSIILMIFLHDTYFYWAHRLMHHPKLFRWLHNVHHKSTNPSPWAAYAFQPLEGIVEASIIFPIIFLIPFHKTAILAFLIFMMAYNVYGHLGYELFPKGFNKHFIGKWLNTSVNHNQHHKFYKGNYGLYFLFWDRWLGTLREDYDAEFAKVDKLRTR